MMRVSSFIWVFLSLSLGVLASYCALLLWNRQKFFKRLIETTNRSEWAAGVYLVLGFAIVTAGVHLIPYVPRPENSLSPFHSGLEAFLFALSWSIWIFLITISYGFFKGNRHPELYLIGLQVFMTGISCALFLFYHSDYFSQNWQAIIAVSVLLIFSVERRTMSFEMKRFIILSLSHMVLAGYTLWALFTGATVIFRFEPRPAKAVFYTSFITLGAVWVYIEGLLAASRLRSDGQTSLKIVHLQPHPQSLPVEEPLPISTGSAHIPFLRIYCLGPFRLDRGEEPLEGDILRSKPLEIVKIIAVSPKQEVLRGRLIDYLYGEDSDGDKATDAFQKNLGRLRGLLDCPGLKEKKESYIVFRKDRYALHPDHAWIDTDDFVNAVRGGKRYLEENLVEQSFDCFQKADRLWRGTLLEDQRDPQEWFLGPRKQMEKIYMDLQVELAKLFLQKKDFVSAELAIQKGLAINPDSEIGVRIIALAQYGQGKKVDAVNYLTDFIKRVEEELETKPSHLTTRLKSKIRLDEKVNPLEWL